MFLIVLFVDFYTFRAYGSYYVIMFSFFTGLKSGVIILIEATPLFIFSLLQHATLSVAG